MDINKKLYIGKQIYINVINRSSPITIILNLWTENKIKGLRYYKNNKNSIMPILELADQTRIWVFQKEIQNIIN